MTNLNKKKRSKLSVIVGVTGAVIGAGAAVAGAIALRNPKNRAKVKKVLTNVKNQAVDYMEKVENEVKKDVAMVSKKADTTERKVNKIVKKVTKEGDKK